MSGTPNPYRHQYEVVPASSTNLPLGNTGAVGDFLHRIVLNVLVSTSNIYTLKDGSVPVISSVVNLTPGIYNLEINAASKNGAWNITTSSQITVIGIGTFTN